LEALCEFVFSDEPLEFSLVETKLQEAVKDLLPDRVEKKNFSVIIKQIEGSFNSESLESGGLIQFSDPIGNRMIQIGSKLLAINQLKPYTSWDDFFPFTMTMLNKYLAISKQQSLTKATIRYINRIDIPSDGITIGDYFKLGITTPNSLSKNIVNFALKTDHLYNSQNDCLQLSLNIVPGPNDQTVSFVFDTNYFILKPQSNALAQIEDWLNKGHDLLDQVFDECLTEKCKNLFN
jgi:uncharacterized protein (TIGR04255 family)